MLLKRNAFPAIWKRFARWVSLAILLACCGLWAQDGDSDPERISLSYGVDPSLKVVMKGRAGNLELQSSDVEGEGFTLTDYQNGSGFVAFDRSTQTLTWRSRIPYTLNRVSKRIMRVAPYMRAHLPMGAALDFALTVDSVGYGTLDFANLHVSRFKLDVSFGDVDVTFPTANQRIVRGTAKFHVMAGDLEIYQLANLKAEKARINGGVGELTVDFGPRLLQDMDVRVDHDIGGMELIIPRGTRVVVSGTSRDLGKFGFQKTGRRWETTSFHENSPTLRLRLTGPLGELNIVWK